MVSPTQLGSMAARRDPVRLPRKLASPLTQKRSLSSSFIFCSRFPPLSDCSIARLETFQLPVTVEANAECELLGEQMIDAWLKDGIFRVKMCSEQNDLLRSSYAHSKSYFKLSDQKKTMELNKNGFAGYLRQPHQEHLRPFTLSKDLPLIDTGLQEGWLWDGRCPFPTAGYKDTMKQLSYLLNKSGQKLLQLIGLGLGLENPNALLRLTERGWHHMRILRFPPLGETNAKTEIRLGRGSQRRRGLLISSSQDVGIFVRSFKTHDDNVTGYDENVFVPPIEGTLTVYPGLTMDFLTEHMPYMPGKVPLDNKERYAFAYFYEPDFRLDPGESPNIGDYKILYSTQCIHMYMRNFHEHNDAGSSISVEA